MEMVKRFDVYLVNLDDELSDDPKNTRPGVVVSPDEMNGNLGHVLIAPLSATNAPYPTRVRTDFLNSERSVILDQIRAVDKGRLVKRIGELDRRSGSATLDLLQEMFAP
jgi:mRNA interferase MazF